MILSSSFAIVLVSSCLLIFQFISMLAVLLFPIQYTSQIRLRLIKYQLVLVDLILSADHTGSNKPSIASTACGFGVSGRKINLEHL